MNDRLHGRNSFSSTTGWTRAVLVGALVTLGGTPAALHAYQGTTPAQSSVAPAAMAGVPFTPEKLSSLLPGTVYFAGRTAPLQLRNAGGTQFGTGAIFWVSLVDSSGYSTALQQRYQFYLVTEGPVRVGNVDLRAGAYGGGFVGDRFVLMDLGDHPLGEGPTQSDAELRRPRPLQIIPDGAHGVKLYLGRRWVSVTGPGPA